MMNKIEQELHIKACVPIQLWMDIGNTVAITSTELNLKAPEETENVK